MQTPSARPALSSSNHDRYDAAALLLLAGLVILVVLTYGSYAISNDEPVQQRYGELIIAYYTSGFADRSLFHLENLYLYGGLFDVTATLIARLLPLDLYDVRHILCALTGIGGIAATWATARLIAGSRAGLIAAALLAVTGAWYGAMFNHTKDVTFAAAMMAATYWLLRSARDLPRPRLRDVLLFGAMLGAALGLRAVGQLMGVYLAAAIILASFAHGPATVRDRMAFVGRSLLAFSPGLFLAYLIMIAFWPWAALGLFNPLRALFAFEAFNYDISDLFAGHVYRMSDMPRSYLPTYLAIKAPMVMLAGAALSIVGATIPHSLKLRITSRPRFDVAFLILAVAFPVALQVLGRGPAFSGMRHFTFVIPPLAALAGVGLAMAIDQLRDWRASVANAAAAAVVALILWDASVLVRLHPHEYLFYNALVGGLPGANGRYATDYWSNSMPEAIRAMEAYVGQMERRSGQPPGTYKVSTCSEPLQFDHVASKQFQLSNIWEEADFFVSVTHMNCDHMLRGEVIATVERMGVVIAVVKDHRPFKGEKPLPASGS